MIRMIPHHQRSDYFGDMDVPGTGKISKMFLNKKLLIFSIFKTTRAYSIPT
jgi:hypothetical protein